MTKTPPDLNLFLSQVSNSHPKGGFVVRIQVQPGAKLSGAKPKGMVGEIIGVTQENPPRLKIKLSAPPVDGRANEAVVEFFSKALNLSKSRVEILNGLKSRKKDIWIKNI